MPFGFGHFLFSKQNDIQPCANCRDSIVLAPKFFHLTGVPGAKISPQGSGKNSMSATAAKSKTNGQSQEAKMELKKNETSKVENSVLTLEKRIQKVEELNIVIEKWRKLGEAKKNLTGFQLGNDGLSSTITLKDAAGREFKTSHNLVVTTVLKTLQDVLDEKISEVEEQINFAV